MQKLIRLWDKYILKIGISFLLLFIPLYPKLPLIDILHTWVYIRLEDLLVAFLVLIFLVELLRRRATIRSPLSLPIFLYWLIGGICTLHAIFILKPSLPHFFPHLALLHYLRRIEYMILFFIAFSSVRSRRDVYHYVGVFLLMLSGVIIYGFGQKFFGFPAFLTMNEEFAKGIPLFLPPEARITSTFAGHYDLAAFLVFSLAFLVSLFFGVKNWRRRVPLLLLIFGAYLLLLFTASRISFVVYLLTVSFTLFLQKKKWLILPVLLLSFFLMREVSGTSVRFGKTFRVQQVVYDVKTGKAIATLEEFQRRPTPTPPPSKKQLRPSLLKPSAKKPPKIIRKKKAASPTPTPTPYEELPLGSGFLEIPLLEKLGSTPTPTPRPIKTTELLVASQAAHLATSSGEFLVKRAIVYDISFTTRFQGEWPRAWEAFRRNIFLGSGYSSISLATDNDYLRLLGETGILGFLSFLGIFFVFLLLIRQGLRKIREQFCRAVIIGVGAGVFGVFVNAFLIDIFEASKVAYVLWIMLGVVVALFMLEVRKKESLLAETLAVLREPVAALLIFALVAAGLFYNAVTNYFVADDFTWLRWAAKTKLEDIAGFFFASQGFFYRPAVKVLFYVLHLFLGLKSYGYHFISFLVHFLVSSLVYLIARSLSKNWLIAFLAGLFFLIHPIHAETVLWVSGYSGLFAALFYFGAFYLFERSYKSYKAFFYLGSLFLFALALASYEMAMTLPAVLLLYVFLYKKKENWVEKILPTLPYLVIFDVYLYLRNIVAQAHWLSGDYSYNLKNFVFNFFGNLGGYAGELLFSFHFLPVYEGLRAYFRGNKLIGFMGLVGFIGLIFLIKKLVRRKITLDKLTVFSFGWFVISLLPVLGLGNIAERYVYIPSFGFLLLIATFIYNSYQKTVLVRRWILEKGLKLGIVLGVLGISLFYFWEMEKAKKDWQEAGEEANLILRALSTTYREFPEGSTLYFVNLPLRVRRAWVFPVGVEDGLWFVYRDETLKFMKGNNLEEALDYKEKKEKVHVFVYQGGELKEAERL